MIGLGWCYLYGYVDMDKLYHRRCDKHARGETGLQMDLDLAALQHAWALPTPWQIQPLTRGTNNRVLRMATPAGEYILRVYSNHADLKRLRFEYGILASLQAAHLPFALPAPIPTTAGELYMRVAVEGSEGLAELTTFIPGEHPRVGDVEQAHAGGEALGMLDLALASLESPDPGDGVSWRSSGDLAHCHVLVPDPPAAFGELPIGEDVRRRLLKHYDWLMARLPSLYETLPQQIVHEDFDMSNVLLDRARVTGVLDFEFCGRDLRVMDLTVAINWWPLDYFGTGGEWPIIDALVAGYAEHLTLSDGEIAALPLLIQFRAFTSLIHRLGRYRQGLSSLESVVQRVNAAVERADWLHMNGERLVGSVRQVFEGKQHA